MTSVAQTAYDPALRAVLGRQATGDWVSLFDDSSWRAASLENSFTNFGLPNAPVRYRRLGGTIHLQGVASKAGAYAAYPGVRIFQLPDGFRPAYELTGFGANVNGAAGRVDVKADGGVWVVGGANFVDVSGVSFPVDTLSTVVCLGDSITNGFNATSGWPAQLGGLLGGGANVVAKGVNGDTLVQAEARRTTDVDPWKPTYAILEAGVNDLMADATAATVQSRIVTTLNGFFNAGYTPIVCTLLPWKNYASFSAPREAVRLSVNQWLRAVKPVGAIVVDLETALSDGGTVAALRSSYDSGDGLHPNNAGAGVFAAEVFKQAFKSRQAQ